MATLIPTANIGGVACCELVSGLSESQEWGRGAHASKQYLVPNWFDRYTVANSLLGLITYSVGSSGSLSIQAPGAYPDSPNLIAQRISIRGVGKPSQGPRQTAFESAIVSVEYGVPAFDVTPAAAAQQSFDPSAPLIFATQSVKYGGQWITIPSSKLKTAGGNSLPESFGRFVGVNSLTVTLHQFPYLPTLAMRALVGKMNNRTIFGAAQGTLIVTGIDSVRAAAVDGTTTQELQMSFEERPEAPWDYTYTGISTGAYPGWEQVVRASDNGAVIRSGDYSALIPAFYGTV